MASVPRRIAAWVAAAALAVLPACDGVPGDRHGTDASGDPALREVLAAMPIAAADRGVYVYRPAAAPDLFPGTFAGADLAVALSEAEWVAESAVPPVIVASGVDASSIPEGSELVGGLLVAAAEPEEAEEAARRIRDADGPVDVLSPLVAAEGFAWGGTAEFASGDGLEFGDTYVFMNDGHLEVRALADHASRAISLADAVEDELRSGGIPSSPGRTWTAMLRAPEVAVEGAEIVVRAKATDLPAALLRQLIETRSLAFLTSG